MSQLNDKLTKTVADAVRGVTTVSEQKMLNEAKYEPAAPDPELVAKRKAREAAAARREEERERKENEFGGGEEKKKPTVHKVAGKRYGGAAQKDDVEESVKSFSGLLESYKDGGIKSLFQNLVKEEATEDEFNAELKKQKDKAEGKAPQADVAAAATQGTKDMKEEVEDLEEELKGNQHKIDANKNGKIDAEDFKKLRKEESEELDERTLTAGETAEKERIVKGMKKGLEGFKQRYGDRAKEVMYATATKQAKKD